MNDKEQKLEQLKKMMEQGIITLEEYKKEEDKIVNYDKIKADNKENIDALIELGIEKFESGKYSETLSICLQILDIDNENDIAKLGEVLCYYYLRKYETALNKIEKFHNQDKDILNLKGLILYAKDPKENYDRALRIFENNKTIDSFINQCVIKSKKFGFTVNSIFKENYTVKSRFKENYIDIKTKLYLHEHLYWYHKKKTNISDYKRYNDLYKTLDDKTKKEILEGISKENRSYLFFDKEVEEHYDSGRKETNYYFYNKKVGEKEINDFLSLYPNYEEDYKNRKLADLGPWRIIKTNGKPVDLLEPIYEFYKNIYAIALATNINGIDPEIALEYYNKAKSLDEFEDPELLCDILISLKRYDEALQIAIDKKYEDKKIFILEKLNRYDEIIKIYDEEISKNQKSKYQENENISFWLYGEKLAHLLEKKLNILEKINDDINILELYNYIIKIFIDSEKDDHGYKFIDKFKYKKSEIYYKKAIILKKLSRFQEAIDTLTKLLKINPNHTDAELLRNILYKKI